VKTVRKVGEFLGRTDIFFYTLLWLIVLLIVGTLDQRFIGLYQAQQKYFSSWILWLWFFPLPGGYPTMGIISIGLVAKLIFISPWRMERLGIIITHLGALLLLFGGLLTAMFSYEGSMVIQEGGSANFIADYHKKEIAIIDTSPADFSRVTTFGPGWLKSGKILQAEDLSFQIEVLKYCRNCNFVRLAQPPEGVVHGFARNFDLQPLPLDKEDERNRAGIVFKVMGAGEGVDGMYAVFEFMPVEQTITVNQTKYIIDIRRAQTHVPFTVHLVDFEKEMYPGTTKPKSFKSVVNLVDGEVEQRSVIWMNHPLRHRNYTLFQASYIEGGARETTVLAVVRNVGRTFPYISSLIMCVGLLIHLLIKTPRLIRSRDSESLNNA
jgi:hypothetical protein